MPRSPAPPLPRHPTTSPAGRGPPGAGSGGRAASGCPQGVGPEPSGASQERSRWGEVKQSPWRWAAGGKKPLAVFSPKKKSPQTASQCGEAASMDGEAAARPRSHRARRRAARMRGAQCPPRGYSESPSPRGSWRVPAAGSRAAQSPAALRGSGVRGSVFEEVFKYPSPDFKRVYEQLCLVAARWADLCLIHEMQFVQFAGKS